MKAVLPFINRKLSYTDKGFFRRWKIFVAFTCWLLPSIEYFAQAQTKTRSYAADTEKVNGLIAKSKAFAGNEQEQAIAYGIQAKELAERIGFTKGAALALKNIGNVYYTQGNYLKAVNYWTQSLTGFRRINDLVGVSNILNNIGVIHSIQGDYQKALQNYLEALKAAEQSGNKGRIASSLNNVGATYALKRETYDKALQYYLRALTLSVEAGDTNSIATTSVNIGEVYSNKGNSIIALQYFKKSLKAYQDSRDEVSIPYTYNAIAKEYKTEGKYDSALYFNQKAYATSQKVGKKLYMVQSLIGLANTYTAKGDAATALDYYKKAEESAKEIRAIDELKDIYQGLSAVYASIKSYGNAFTYQSLYSNIKDTIYNIESDKKLASLQFDFDLQKKQGEIDMLTKDRALQTLEVLRQKFARNTLAASLVFVFVIAFVLFKLYRKVGRRTLQLRRSLEELRSTQAQLIQSEKMASLGSLTAGIAHEIQNPLNFVTNFSEVNVELLQELKEGPLKVLPENDQIEAIEIITDLAQNMQKINHHGKRADAIVKGMLQHSRRSEGKKEPTNINALADEYLRLSYQSIRAKDSSFNVDMLTHFDENIGKINIIPQDIGRVLLNLFENAFYSVTEKKKLQPEGYKPTVSISTKKLTDKIEVIVKDNGMGIPQKILDKIFQPFYTTKPTGQGTGLGLSLSYDIIKAHGGELKAETKEGEYAEFIIFLPLVS
jgi:two-component system NtrC family sensor kinase